MITYEDMCVIKHEDSWLQQMWRARVSWIMDATLLPAPNSDWWKEGTNTFKYWWKRARSRQDEKWSLLVYRIARCVVPCLCPSAIRLSQFAARVLDVECEVIEKHCQFLLNWFFIQNRGACKLSREKNTHSACLRARACECVFATS